jgi:hypothetical protein
MIRGVLSIRAAAARALVLAIVASVVVNRRGCGHQACRGDLRGQERQDSLYEQPGRRL